MGVKTIKKIIVGLIFCVVLLIVSFFVENKNNNTKQADKSIDVPAQSF